MDLIHQGLSLVQNPRHTTWIAPLLVLADTALSLLVVWKVPYTEIDWKAYNQQILIYLSGERDYAKIYGETGPLVYPAAHVYIYRFLHYLTDSGTNIHLAQYIFVALYLATLSLALATYRQAQAPPWVLPMLVLSKRLHSIFMLRLFNDGFAVFLLFAAILAWQRRMWTIGSVLFSLGLGVKMSLLLALPAVGAVLLQGMGRDRALKQAMLMGQVQVMLGYEFLAAHPRSYLTRAFEFSRQFMFKWTVNWRFVGEDTFLSRPFSIGLLATHAALILVFLQPRWLKPAGVDWQTLPRWVLRLYTPPAMVEERISRRVTPAFILTSILSAITIGCLCARSLHYQFYAYLAWSTPFLLWRSGLHPILVCFVWAVQEWAWNVYPSTNVSSAVVVACLAVSTGASWVALDKSDALLPAKKST